jgi:hypothetical protein
MDRVEACTRAVTTTLSGVKGGLTYSALLQALQGNGFRFGQAEVREVLHITPGSPTPRPNDVRLVFVSERRPQLFRSGDQLP